jgi:hypothetical protein
MRVDANFSDAAAFGDAFVPKEMRERHDLIKPHLRIVPVVHWGFDGLVHVGQIIVNEALEKVTEHAFAGMFRLHFPIFSVIPHSQFEYDDEKAMRANNTSNYRPGLKLEHPKGGAYDINTFVNNMDTTVNGVRKIIPEGSSYNPWAKGAITKEGQVRRLFGSLAMEWGGGWGDPHTNPRSDFYQKDYFDYQHFQPNEFGLHTLVLPEGF